MTVPDGDPSAPGAAPTRRDRGVAHAAAVVLACLLVSIVACYVGGPALDALGSWGVAWSGLGARLSGSGKLLAPETFDAAGLPVVGHVGGKPAARLVVRGTRAYVGLGPEFTVLDVGGPGAPRRVGSVLLADRVQDFVVIGRYAWVGNGNHGVRVLDLGAGDRPREVAGLNAGVGADDVTVWEGRFYARSRRGDVAQIATALPLRPTVAATWDGDSIAAGIPFPQRVGADADRPGAPVVLPPLRTLTHDTLAWTMRGDTLVGPGGVVATGVADFAAVTHVVRDGDHLIVAGRDDDYVYWIAAYDAPPGRRARRLEVEQTGRVHDVVRVGDLLYTTSSFCALDVYALGGPAGLTWRGGYCPPKGAHRLLPQPGRPGRLVATDDGGVHGLTIAGGAAEDDTLTSAYVTRALDRNAGFAGDVLVLPAHGYAARLTSGGEWGARGPLGFREDFWAQVAGPRVAVFERDSAAPWRARDDGRTAPPPSDRWVGIYEVAPSSGAAPPRVRRLGRVGGSADPWWLEGAVLYDTPEVTLQHWVVRARDVSDPNRPRELGRVALPAGLRPFAWGAAGGGLEGAGYLYLRLQVDHAEEPDARGEGHTTDFLAVLAPARAAGRGDPAAGPAAGPALVNVAALRNGTEASYAYFDLTVQGGLVGWPGRVSEYAVRDLRDPARPRPLAAVDLAAWYDRALTFYRAGDRLYVGSEDAGVFVFALPAGPPAASGR